jgi:hypothetical protein
MPTGPVQFVDGLVTGIILVAYDFARLTLAGLLIPFVARTRRFWPNVFAMTKRLSSLSYLVLWVLMSVSIGTETSTQLISDFSGLEKGHEIGVLRTIVIAISVSIVVDLLVRASCSKIRDRIRRQLYESLGRIAIANIFLGASCIMLLSPGGQLLNRLFALFTPGPLPGVNYPNPALYAFSFSLVAVALKGSAIRGRLKRFGFGALIVVGAPVLFMNIFLWTVLAANAVADMMYPSRQMHLLQQFPQCELAGDQIHVSALLRLEGAPTAAIKASDLAIYESAHDGYMGSPSEDEGAIVVSNLRYTQIRFLAKYQPGGGTNMPPGKFECSLKLLSRLEGPSNSTDVTPSPPVP